MYIILVGIALLKYLNEGCQHLNKMFIAVDYTYEITIIE